MYGWRGRIGLLVPAANTVVEPECGAMAPAGVTIYASRMLNLRADVADNQAMLAHAERAATELARLKPDVVAFACTSGSFVEGVAGEEDLRHKLERVAGCPAVTTAGAVAAALRNVAASRISMVTPYLDEVNEREVAFLQSQGFEVLRFKGMQIEDAFSIGKVGPGDVYRLARDTVAPGSDAIFISCTNLRTIEIIDALERDTGLPVVTSNQATFWASLEAMNCQEPIVGYGRLLELGD
ncbi:MAG: aspartate/glutamate racemase family protein [Chloroflexi bacterium]|nr:aspartate/glutamate racemase family protein [Chloroflexota bacterium]